MNSSSLFFPLLLGLAAIPATASAQSTEQVSQEFEGRLIAEAQKKVFKGFRVFVAPELRTEDIDPNRYLLELGARYRITKWLRVGTGYRWGLEEKRNREETKHRLRLDAVGRYEWDDFEAQLRLRYQSSFGPEADARHRFRYRGKFGYSPLKVLSFAATVEAFQDISSGEFAKMRYGAGASYRFHKSKKVKQFVALDYRFDYHLQELLNVHILRLGYKIVF